MLITALEVAKRNKGRVNVYMDGEFYCSLTAYTVAQRRLKQGQELTVAEFDEILLTSEVQKAFDLSLGYVSKYIKTEKQVCDYLAKKGFAPQVCQKAVDKLKYYKYLDDEQYAKNYAQSNANVKGARRIERELVAKGIDKERAKLSAEVDKEQSQSACNTLAAKFLANKPINMQTLQKLQRFLLYRGFDYEQINVAVRSVGAEEE